MTNTYQHYRQMLDEGFIETMQMVHRGKDIEQAAKEAWADLDLSGRLPVEQGDYKKYVNRWLANKPFPKTVHTKVLHDLK